MTMAESDRRPGKTLIKQTEIEEVDEGDAETNGSPNSDKSDTTITPGNETPVAQSATGSPDSENADEQTQSPQDGTMTMTTVVVQAAPEKIDHPPVRTNSQSKMKTLQRAVALCEDMSPPPEITYSSDDQDSKETRVTSGQRLEKCGSQSSEAGTSSSLSRESSLDTQYKDSTGIDLEEFIKRTLNKSVKDRKMILQLARDLKKFIKEPKHQFLQFAEMSSYDRMLVHRIAAFFGLDHNVDQSGKAVIVSKTKITRIPDFSFEDHIQKGGDPLGTKKKILPRKAPSLEEKESRGLEKHQFGNNRAKSLEERQKSYEEAKARIFKNGESSSEDLLACAPSVSNSRSGKSSLMSSKEDLGSRQPSTDSSGYGSSENTGKHSRLSIQKAHSYGGMPGQSAVKYQTSASLNKADSVSSGASGSFDCGSGRPYPVPTSPPGSHSDHSPLSRSSSTGPVPSPLTSGGGTSGQNSQYAFLVAMDPTNIPPGSMIVNPQTLQPHVNPDGSLYRYDPAQPPPWLLNAGMSVHPSTPSSSSFPNSLPTQYSSEHEINQRLSNFSLSQPTDIIESQQQGGPVPPSQGPHIMMSTQQPYQTQPPYLQQTYFPTGPQGVTGQPVRYTYQVPYQVQSQGSVDGQPQPHSANVPHIGQYSQPCVQGYPATNYPNVVLQPSASQSAEMSGSSSVSQTGLYTGPHPDSSVPTYSIQYSPYSQQQQQQQQQQQHQSSYGQQAQSPVFYSVSSTTPQLGYSFTGHTASTIRPTTPPSQGNNVHNPSIAINMAQPVNFQQQASGSGGGHTTANSQQYGTYPVYPQLHQQAAAIRPVNQVVQIPGVQSHTTPGPSTQQPFSIIRPSMQVGLPPGNLPPQAGSIGQHAMGFKGYSINPCFQKQNIAGDGKDVGPSPAVLPGNLGHITGHMATSGAGVRTQQLGTGDLRMLGTTYRPQLQPLHFGQRASNQQPPTPQQPNKPRYQAESDLYQ